MSDILRITKFYSKFTSSCGKLTVFNHEVHLQAMQSEIPKVNDHTRRYTTLWTWDAREGVLHPYGKKARNSSMHH